MAIRPVAFLINTNYDGKLMVIAWGQGRGTADTSSYNVNQSGSTEKAGLVWEVHAKATR